MKIIVVDDDINALHAFLNDVIGEQNIEYKFYRDDVEAICDYVSKNHIDAAFLDVNMPQINGIELAQKLLKINPALKLVFITGLAISEYDLPLSIKNHTLGFLYKPYSVTKLQQFLSLIKDEPRVLKVEMFETFDCFIDNKKVKFSSAKSKELFALLLAYNGKTLTMNDAISQLWPDSDVEKSKILYRDAVWRLRKTLDHIGINCVEWGRAMLSLDKTNIFCDYWNYLLTGKGNYLGEFCKSYDWSMYYLAKLDGIRKRQIDK